MGWCEPGLVRKCLPASHLVAPQEPGPSAPQQQAQGCARQQMDAPGSGLAAAHQAREHSQATTSMQPAPSAHWKRGARAEAEAERAAIYDAPTASAAVLGAPLAAARQALCDARGGGTNDNLRAAYTQMLCTWSPQQVAQVKTLSLGQPLAVSDGISDLQNAGVRRPTAPLLGSVPANVAALNCTSGALHSAQGPPSLSAPQQSSGVPVQSQQRGRELTSKRVQQPAEPASKRARPGNGPQAGGNVSVCQLVPVSLLAQDSGAKNVPQPKANGQVATNDASKAVMPARAASAGRPTQRGGAAHATQLEPSGQVAASGVPAAVVSMRSAPAGPEARKSCAAVDMQSKANAKVVASSAPAALTPVRVLPVGSSAQDSGIASVAQAKAAAARRPSPWQDVLLKARQHLRWDAKRFDSAAAALKKRWASKETDGVRSAFG